MATCCAKWMQVISPCDTLLAQPHPEIVTLGWRDFFFTSHDQIFTTFIGFHLALSHECTNLRTREGTCACKCAGCTFSCANTVIVKDNPSWSMFRFGTPSFGYQPYVCRTVSSLQTYAVIWFRHSWRTSQSLSESMVLWAASWNQTIYNHTLLLPKFLLHVSCEWMVMYIQICSLNM